MTKIPKEAHTVSSPFSNNIIPLEEENKEYIDNLCPDSKKVQHPEALDFDKKPLAGESYQKKMMTLAESIEYIGNSYRSSLSQAKYFPTKEKNDEFLRELRTVSLRLDELLKETIYGDKAIFASRAKGFGISEDTINTLEKAISELQPDIDVAEERNRARQLQKIATTTRCFIYDAVRDAFERYGLTPTYYEDDGKRSPFYQCLYIALQLAGDNMIENMDKVHQHCIKSKYQEPTK